MSNTQPSTTPLAPLSKSVTKNIRDKVNDYKTSVEEYIKAKGGEDTGEATGDMADRHRRRRRCDTLSEIDQKEVSLSHGPVPSLAHRPVTC